ncbi:hypothetical protein MMC30_005725 [Trapelia coarctata]|nr:hypothetical protein [Trapelia coarctata]
MSFPYAMRLHKHGLLPLLRRPWLRSQNHRAQCVLQFSTIVSSEPSRVTIPVGASGSITLDIHTPSHRSPSTPILIYLPAGPLLPERAPELNSLRVESPLTVVRINYRLDSTHPYPLPIHDVLAGYDWVVHHLVRGVGAHNGWQSPDGRMAGGNGRGVGNGRVAGVAVCGELIGGGLAAMLACTEGRVGRMGHVKAVVVGGPVVDWTGMFPVKEGSGEGEGKEGAGPVADGNTDGDKGAGGRAAEGVGATKRRTTKVKTRTKPDSWREHSNSPFLSASTLLHARDTLFAKPEHYHDPFASPLLFFHTASSDIPSLEPPSSPSPHNPSSPSSPANTTPDASATDPTTLIDFIRKRRAHRRHPPLGSGLVLPRTRVDVGRESVLRDQGVEFVEGMRRSLGVSEKGRMLGRGDVWAEQGRGRGGEGLEERIELREVEGVGLWGEEEMVGVGGWVGRVMRAGE